MGLLLWAHKGCRPRIVELPVSAESFRPTAAVLELIERPSYMYLGQSIYKT